MQEEPITDEDIGLLKALKPEKLTQLSERFVRPSLTTNGPVPMPSFPSSQEFFKDFILHANNPVFYTHLENCLVYEILESNDTQFTNSEIEDGGKSQIRKEKSC